MRHEEIELQTPAMTASTSGTFDFGRTPAESTTQLNDVGGSGAGLDANSDSKAGKVGRNQQQRPAGDEEPQEGAVEVAPEGGYGWVVVGACSVAM